MPAEHQTLTDIPMWLVLMLAMAGGVTGEMWRADKEGMRGLELLRRIALRSGASVVCGLSTMMLLQAADASVWTSGGIGCLTAMAGADLAIGLYERWVAKRLGVTKPLSSEAEPKQ